MRWILRRVFVCEITLALHLGALCDWWAGRAVVRLGKLSERFHLHQRGRR